MTVSVKVNWRNRKNNEVIEPETFGLFKDQVKPAPPAGAGKRPAEDVCQTLTFEVGTEDSGRNVKQLLKSKLATPTECLRLKHPPTGKIVTDDTKLSRFGPTFVVELELESTEPDRFPIEPKRRLKRAETKESDILSVGVRDDDGNVKLVDVEIVVQQGPKPFLGGYRHTKTGVEYHHAITQTVEGLKKDWNQYLEETYTREIQTVPFRNTFAQTDVDKGTQTASPGFHVCTGTDREIQGDPDRYVNSTEHRIQQVGAIVKIQRITRKYLDKRQRKKLEARRKAQLESQSYDLFDSEDPDFDTELE